MQWTKLSLTLFTLMISPSLFSQQTSVKVDFSGWSNYAMSIEHCSRGEFVLPDPVRVAQIRIRYSNIDSLEPEKVTTIKNEIEKALVIYQIDGLDKNNRCHVMMLDKPQIDTPTTSPAPPYGQECYFSTQDLLQLANTARKIAGGQFVMFSEDPDASLKGPACKEMVSPLPTLLPKPEKNTR